MRTLSYASDAICSRIHERSRDLLGFPREATEAKERGRREARDDIADIAYLPFPSLHEYGLRRASNSNYSERKTLTRGGSQETKPFYLKGSSTSSNARSPTWTV